MYGLPDDFDAGAFVGRTLEQVCFTENQVTLHFDGMIDITVESAFVHGDRKSESSHPVIGCRTISLDATARVLDHRVVR